MNAPTQTDVADTLDEGDLVELDVAALAAELTENERERVAALHAAIDTENTIYATHLAELRRAVKRSQADLAAQLGISQPSVAALEKSTDPYVSTIQRYVAALGARAELVVTFPDQTRIALGLETLNK